MSYNIKDNEGQKGAAAMLDNSDMTWKPGRFRIAPVSTHRNISITEGNEKKMKKPISLNLDLTENLLKKDTL